MSGEVHGTAGPLPRLARLLLGRNELRRPCDRIEGAILLALSAAFLTSTVVAALLAGHLYQSQRAAAARLRPTLAVVSSPGPVVASANVLETRATWRLADGTERSGMLTGAIAPAIYDAQTGTTLPVWLNRSGNPQPPPPGQDDIIAAMLIVTTIIPAGAAVLLTCCYWPCRVALDRHRLARWGQAWAVTGPRWTSRR
jgi:hypothetical protein